MQSPATELNHKYIHCIGLSMSDTICKPKIAQPQQQNDDISDRGKLLKLLSQDFEKKLPCSPALLLVCRNRKDVVNVRKAKIVRASHEVRAATLSGDQDWRLESGEPLQPAPSCLHEYGNYGFWRWNISNQKYLANRSLTSANVAKKIRYLAP